MASDRLLKGAVAAWALPDALRAALKRGLPDTSSVVDLGALGADEPEEATSDLLGALRAWFESQGVDPASVDYVVF